MCIQVFLPPVLLNDVHVPIHSENNRPIKIFKGIKIMVIAYVKFDSMTIQKVYALSTGRPNKNRAGASYTIIFATKILYYN